MNVRIKKDELKPESVELLAKSVVQVAEASKKLLNSGLNQDGIITLLHPIIGATKINKKQIKLVLDNLPRLKSWYVREPRKT